MAAIMNVLSSRLLPCCVTAEQPTGQPSQNMI